MYQEQTPLVSVIINCLNGEEFIEDALNSVYRQSYPNWEIIFWDNASNDKTAEIAKRYGKKLRYFRSKKTLVLGLARCEATKRARGEYLAFLDVDDYWNKDKLQKQMDLFLQSDDKIGFVYGKSEVVYNGDGNKPFFWSEHEKLHDGDIFHQLVKSNFIVFSSLVVNRKKFFECGGFPHTFVNSTDYYLLVHMAKKYRCKFLDETCCYYRLHDNNLSKRQKAISVLEAIKVCNEFLPDESVDKGIRNHYAHLALIYIKEYKFNDFFKLLFERKCLPNFSRLLFKRIYQRVIG